MSPRRPTQPHPTEERIPAPSRVLEGLPEVDEHGRIYLRHRSPDGREVRTELAPHVLEVAAGRRVKLYVNRLDYAEPRRR